MTIRSKVIYLLLFCSMVPFIAIATISYQSSKGALEEKIGRVLESGSHETMVQLETFFNRTLVDFNAWSVAPIMQDSLIDDVDEEIADTLTRMLRQYDQFTGFLVTNDEGQVIAATDQNNRQRDLLRHEAVLAALKGDVFQGSLGQSDLAAGRTLILAVPIRANYDPDTIIGGVVGFVDWPYIQMMLSEIDVFGSKQDKSNYLAILSLGNGLGGFRGDDNILFIPSGVSTIMAAMPTVEGVALKTIGGQEFIVGTSLSEGRGVFANPNWIVHQIVATDEAYASVIELRNELVFIAVIMGVIIAGIGYWGASRLSSPIVAITGVMDLLAKGDVEVDIPGQGRRDEVGRMALSIEAWRKNIIERQRLIAEQKELKVKQKMRDIQMAQLNAESANKFKSEFLANMSHELRSPLNAILGFSEVIMKKTLGPAPHLKYDEYIKDIHHSGKHLLDVINDILDLSKIEAGETVIDETIFDLRDPIKISVHMVKGQSGAVCKRISMEKAMHPIHFRGDERLLKQIILNLLSNAVKFTPEDGQIYITAEVTPNGNVLIRVEDTGCGIPANDLERVLEAFGQSRANAHVAHGGTGLGLSLSVKLTELHGGTLSIESEVGIGTCVTLLFPAGRTVLMKQIV